MKRERVFARNVFIALLATFLIPFVAIHGDTVYLRDGRVISNVKTRIIGNEVEVRGKTTIRLPIREVRSILPGPTVEEKPAGDKHADRPDLPATPEKKEASEPAIRNPRGQSDSDASNESPHPHDKPLSHSWWMYLAGPIPGWSPLFFKNRPGYGTLSGGAEVASLIPLALSLNEPVRPGLETYLTTSLFLTTVSPTGGNGPGGKGNPFTMNEVLTNALLLQFLDRSLSDPVEDPFRPDHYISNKQFMEQRTRLALLFLGIVTFDSLTAWFVDESVENTVATPDQPVFRFSLFPEITACRTVDLIQQPVYGQNSGFLHMAAGISISTHF